MAASHAENLLWMAELVAAGGAGVVRCAGARLAWHLSVGELPPAAGEGLERKCREMRAPTLSGHTHVSAAAKLARAANTAGSEQATCLNSLQ